MPSGIRGIRQSIPSGFVLGRTEAGTGAVHLIPLKNMASGGSIGGGSGSVVAISAGTGLDGGTIVVSGTISLADTAVTPGTYGTSTAVARITVDQQGRITGVANTTIAAVTSVATGTGLTGGPITTTGTIALANTAVTPNPYGSASAVAVITVDAQGRITAAASTAIAIAAAAVSGLAAVATSGAYSSLSGLPTLDAWSAFTPNRTGWTDVGSPTVTGRKCQIKNVMYFQVKAVPATTTATVAGTSYIDLPGTAAGLGGEGSMMNLTTLVGIGECVIDVANSRVYVPTQTATGNTLTIAGWFEV